jgi:HEAT repeat protein
MISPVAGPSSQRTFTEETAMTTTVNRRTNPAKRRRPRHTPHASGLVWLEVALGLGVAGGLVLMAGFAFAPRGLDGAARAEGAALLTLATAYPASLAGGPPAPPAPPVQDEQPEILVSGPAPDVEPEPPATSEPTPEPLPAAESTSPGQPRPNLSEDDLRRQLRRVPEFGLKPATRDALAESYKTAYQSNTAMGRKPSFDPGILLKRVPAAQQLPVRTFPVCQLPPDSAVTLGVLSRALHAYLDGLAPKDATGKRGNPIHVREVLRKERRGKPPAWLRPEALPAMVQILMAEDVPLRLILVDMMADIPGRAASVRLAQRAVFDVSPEVRQAAIDALRQRPAGEARRTLVAALRYPWAPAADHAASALVALGDRDAAPLMVDLLDQPDPAAPYPMKTGASVHELVRVNHVQNCLLCHVPSVGRDPVTDVDPFTNRPSQTYDVGYGGPKIPGGTNGVWANRVLIRADVQFFRQDFSVTLPPDGSYSSGPGLRFDFLVRTRPLKPAEVREWENYSHPPGPSYPQRDATLAALRAITGQDAGATTAAWRDLYPYAHAEAEGQRLAAALRAASPDQREQLLARYRDAADGHYTEGLAHAIAHVPVRFQDKVRAALVARLARLPADDLRGHLEDEGELRRAAAKACVAKADATMIPDLTNLLADEDAEVRETAQQALRRLTGEDAAK